MKILFRYEYMHVTYPTCILATCIYFDPEDSTLCVSDGIDWWEADFRPLDGECKIQQAYKQGCLDLLNFPVTFRLCK